MNVDGMLAHESPCTLRDAKPTKYVSRSDDEVHILLSSIITYMCRYSALPTAVLHLCHRGYVTTCRTLGLPAGSVVN